MKYIWEWLIQADNQGIKAKQRVYLPPKRFSPYLELNAENLNQGTLPTEIEVNPYYRFNNIFKDYFHPENREDLEIRQVLFDLIMHYLAELDRYKGMTKREYHLHFVIKDIKSSLYGPEVQDYFQTLTLTEQKMIAHYVLRLYQTSEALYLFEEAIKQWFNQASLYANARERDQIFLYVAQKAAADPLKKIKLLEQLFLPCKYELDIYWESFIGLIGVDETMRLDQMVIY